MTSRKTLPRVLIVLLGAALAAVVPLAGCGGTAPEWPNRPGPKVMASFPPLYCFALNVAGDDAVVQTAMSNQGPHHFDPKLADARRVTQADLFVINGLGLDERIAQKMKDGSGNPNLTVVNLGELFKPEELEEGTCQHDHEDDHAHDHGKDPHVWLGIGYAVRQMEGIRDALKERDPAHAEGYDRRAAEYAARLRKVEADGKAMLQGKKDRKFITFHGSLAYFAKTFGLEIADVIQKVPGQEPTAQELTDLVGKCKANRVRVIAVEPQYSGQKSAKRILEELRRQGIEDPVLVEIDPLETARDVDLTADWYEAKMRENVTKLAEALK
ncbi:MAG TPA: metal ABC transporter substrate-binding protein [Fimbriiglobus sp.]|nr:metal ABC transporter substrate-binding protein [Fimbriiglobus sp.]